MPESVSFDRAADVYDATRGYPQATADAIGAALFAAAGGRPGLRVLEIGIGTGRISIPLLALGANVTGVDLSTRMMDRLRANLAARQAEQPAAPWGTLDLRQGDMTALPFADGSFDAIVAVHVFHLVYPWERALDEAVRVLAPGGSLLLGNDRHSSSADRSIHERWSAIIRELGGDPRTVGVGSESDLLAGVRARGLTVRESIPVRWEVQHTPREDARDITARVWSRTWAIPDDIFAESARRLEAWATEHFGAALDVPAPVPGEFQLLQATRPA
ncbi:MAG TPA: class I SAM-dependent methyltransferase [Ktedonobacterales bacterium]|nr:class I SAM-dependent methyltransferase [Ktedonobacterales bacterium]